MFEFSNVGLVKDGKHILKNINWTIHNKEAWVLFGRNGSGKTMLLEMLMGYIWPTSGKIVRFGMEPYTYDVRAVRKRIGYLSTHLKSMFTYHQDETILDVVLSGLWASVGIYDAVNETDRSHALELLQNVGMAERSNELFHYCSDGEKQKILLQRALINAPDLLILDEPSMGLDVPSREELLATIEKSYVRKPVTIIYVTHHTEEITKLFSNICILDSGVLHYTGSVEDGLTSERLSNLFNTGIEVVRSHDRYYTFVK